MLLGAALSYIVQVERLSPREGSCQPPPHGGQMQASCQGGGREWAGTLGQRSLGLDSNSMTYLHIFRQVPQQSGLFSLSSR